MSSTRADNLCKGTALQIVDDLAKAGAITAAIMGVVDRTQEAQ